MPDGSAAPPPVFLSETRLYLDVAARTPAPGVISYRVGQELWSDGAAKQRWLFLPEGTAIDTSDPDRWSFPIGTRAWKEFRRDGVLVETRMLAKVADGPEGWQRVAYVWNADGSDAVATAEGVADAAGTTHDVPSSMQCWTCHRGVRDMLIGVSALQLAGADDGVLLAELWSTGRLTDPPVMTPRVPGPTEVGTALGYLHANCGHCHNDHHPLATRLELRLFLPTGLADSAESPAYLTAIGGRAHHVLDGTDTIVAPGDPDRSQLLVRMGARDNNQMPPLGTEQVDARGLTLIRDWISGLP